MTTNSNIRIGTLIHGTLRDEDLLAAFADELERLDTGHYGEIKEARALLAIGADEWSEEQREYAGWLINEILITALNDYAPPHTYFGAHEGDGSDFGYWPTWSYVDGDGWKAWGEDEGCEVRNIDEGIGWQHIIDISCRVYVTFHEIEAGVAIKVSQLRGEEIWRAV
jgi:hypothetical protein